MMSKWINAESVISKLNSHVGFTTRPDVTRAIKIIKDEPGIDVIRCKDCRYRKMKKTKWRSEPYIYYRCELLEREVEDDEFCSWGDE